jgi:glutaredoxin
MTAKEVKVYSTTTCPYCIMEKQWLDANKIPHKVVYVDRDEKEAMRMVENTGQMGVPVTFKLFSSSLPRKTSIYRSGISRVECVLCSFKSLLGFF